MQPFRELDLENREAASVVTIVTVELHFHSVRSYYFCFLHSELYKAKQGFVRQEIYVFFSHVALWHRVY